MSVPVLNMIIASADPGSDSKSIALTENFKKTILSRQAYHVGQHFFVSDVESIKSILTEYSIDVVVCLSNLTKQGVGAGTLRQWRELSPYTRFVLIMPRYAINGKKPSILFNNKFYDGVFMSQNSIELETVIAQGRSAQEAKEYYQVQENDDANIIPASVQENRVPKELTEETDVQKKSIHPEISRQEAVAEEKQKPFMQVHEPQYYESYELPVTQNVEDERYVEEVHTIPYAPKNLTVVDVTKTQSNGLMAGRVGQVEAAILYVLDEDTAIIKITRNASITLSNEVFQGAVVSIPYVKG